MMIILFLMIAACFYLIGMMLALPLIIIGIACVLLACVFILIKQLYINTKEANITDDDLPQWLVKLEKKVNSKH